VTGPDEAAAVAEARWEAADLLSRRPALAADLLRGHAAELAASPTARDQLLGLALERAAADLDAGRAPLADAYDPIPPRAQARRPSAWPLAVIAVAAGIAAAVAASVALADA
jgi:hypothetical protein